MKWINKNLWVVFASLVLVASFSIGVATFAPSYTNAQEPVKIENVVPSHDSLNICKDEAGAPRACSDKDLLDFLMVSLGGAKGLGALGFAFLLSKLLLLLLLSPMFASMYPSLMKGSVKLTIALGLNLVVGILSLMMPPVGLSFLAALTHSSVLALGSVFANQAYKQYFTAKGGI